ncbi:MAG: enoyl-CoA hydratase/isomerase family protein [Rhizobiales bacterium]|nr:enoyl-CoA hydratase/isomerase family protein [Hyphomicrobiales bacterium]
MTSKYCRKELSGGILTLTIDRPEVLNALHPAAHRELAGAFDDFAADPAARVAIITGVGERAFCVGTDLKALAADNDHDKPATGFAGITRRFDLWKPVIAAVNGLCLGGGVEIVAACDLAVASEDAMFALPEPRVGLAALGGGALQRLVRQIGMKDAMWLVLSGERIGAGEARRIGLINEVAPRGRALARAREMAEVILRCAPLAVEASKQVMVQSLAEADLDRALGATYPAAARMLASADAREGPHAFAEKREPVWTGR